jgi:hypothetical protein
MTALRDGFQLHSRGEIGGVPVTPTASAGFPPLEKARKTGRGLITNGADTADGFLGSTARDAGHANFSAKFSANCPGAVMLKALTTAK